MARGFGAELQEEGTVNDGQGRGAATGGKWQ